ncbi:hypothetical protein [Pleomorphovibrio marinus]|uniref:hypothetical protein n=1 Tax=Pleomorphovibrio marinus TaxID=2164132 RepID=UPI000E0B2F11|nr:hypothetical protein [Pleomorphovibrio marinus]
MAEKKVNHPTFSMPLRGILLLGGIYTFIWGAFFKWFGDALLSWLAMGESIEASSNVFGTFGMIVGALIFLSAFYPFSWIYLMLAGTLGKVVSALWFVFIYLDLVGWNKRSIFHLTFNELVWIIPLFFILYRANQVKKYLRDLNA